MVDRLEFLGLGLDPLTLDETVVACDKLVRGTGSHQHVVLNASKVVQAHEDPELRAIINACSIINADGMSIVWGARCLGGRIPERVTGIDLMFSLLRLAAEKRYGVYLLGAEPAVLDKVAAEVERMGVKLAGKRDGYWGEEETPEVVAAVAASGADLLFLGIPSPRKEYFLAHHLEQLKVPLSVGVGGSFDILAGVTKRAPLCMQQAGLEWLFRLVQEPRRLAKRYLIGNTRYMLLIAKSRLKHSRRGVAKPRGSL